MVRAWYIEGDAFENPRDEHHRLPPKFITLEDLYRISGVEYYSVNLDSYENELQRIQQERGYSYEDELETPPDSDLEEFYKEHCHENEEIRFVLEGCGYYDIRDKDDEWVRVEVRAGDLIVVPAGCYHRFMLDHTNEFKAKRLFLKSPEYKAFKRPADTLNFRRQYLKNLETGAFEISE